jgi:hypothetical protein
MIVASWKTIRCAVAGVTLPFLGSCAEVPLKESGPAASLSGLKQSDGLFTKTRYYADKNALLAAKSVKIVPAAAAPSSAQVLTQKQLTLVTNAIDRSVCAGLSRRLMVVKAAEPSDLTVRTEITAIGKTDEDAALVSAGLGVGSTGASAATGIPIPSVRLPIGMGSLGVEARVTGPKGEPVAALLWARGADFLTTNARVAAEGDAHTLAAEFGGDFSKLILTGSDPMSDFAPDLPNVQGVNEFFGGRPKYAACEQFGQNPGLGNMVGAKIGLPPAWTDDGPGR